MSWRSQAPCGTVDCVMLAKREPGRTVAVGLVAVLVATLLVYIPSVRNGFTYDDAAYVKVQSRGNDNVMVRELHSPLVYFQAHYGKGIHQSRGFRPATVMSLALTHHVFRSELPKDTVVTHETHNYREGNRVYSDPPWPHHLINVLLHVLATSLCYLLVRVLGGSALGAVCAAGVFGLHALHSDPVVSIVGRAELLGFVFGALATLALLGLPASTKARPWLYLLAGLSAFLAYCSKESALVWLAFAPLCAWVSRGWGRPSRSLALGSLGLLVPALLFLFLRAPVVATAQSGGFDVAWEANSLYHLSLLERLPSAAWVYCLALLKVVWPWPLAADHGGAMLPQVAGFTAPRALVALFLLPALLVTALWFGRRNGLVLLAAAAWFGFSFLISNIPFPIETIFGERLYYTPILGPCLLVAFLADRLQGRIRGGFLAGLAILMVANAVMVVIRCLEWRNNETLFHAEALRSPRASGMNLNAAGLLREKIMLRAQSPPGDGEDTAELHRRFRWHIDRVLEHCPQSSLAPHQLALYHRDLGQLAEAEEWFLKALQAPAFVRSRDGPTIHLDLGRLCWFQGRIQEARRHAERAIEYDAQCVPAWTLRFWCLWRLFPENDDLARRCEEAAERAIGANAAVVVMMKGLLAHRAGDARTAAHLLFESLRALQPVSPLQLPAYPLAAAALLEVGRVRAAEDVVRAALATLEERPFAGYINDKLREDHLASLQGLRRKIEQRRRKGDMR